LAHFDKLLDEKKPVESDYPELDRECYDKQWSDY
jgi:hypothetical protein